jgi:hypothetical protein
MTLAILCYPLRFRQFKSFYLSYAVARPLSRANKAAGDTEQRGKTSMGWFYGFKLHVISNPKGELIRFKRTTGGADDRKPI